MPANNWSKKMNKKLINAVIKQSGGLRNLSKSANDITNNGAAGGYAGFINYTDTCAFTKRNHTLIMKHLKDCADDMGTNAIELLSEFSCFKDMDAQEIFDGLTNPDSDDRTTVYNGLAWFALEEAVRSLEA